MSYKLQFQVNQVPEWKSAYFNYTVLREMLSPFKKVTRTIPIENLTIKLIQNKKLDCNIPSEVQTKLCILDEEFIQLFQEESNKCNQFFLIQMNILNYQLERSSECSDIEMRKSLEILYKKGQFLKQFKKSNIQAAERILGQYSHYTAFIDNSERHLIEFYKNLPFVNNTSLNKTIKKIKSLYINYGWEEFELEKLKYLFTKQQNLLLFGLLGGIILFLVMSFIYQRIDLIYINLLEDFSTYLLFITLGIPICYLWLFAYLLQILKKSYINYWIIFQIEYIKDSRYKLYYLASIITILYLLIVNYGFVSEMQLYADHQNLIYYNMFHFFRQDPIKLLFYLWVLLFAFMINPLQIFGFEARKYFWILQLQTLSGLYLTKDVIWNCEQMVSSSQFFRLFSYSILYYIQYFKNKDVNNVEEFNSISQCLLIIPFIYRLFYSLRLYHKCQQTNLEIGKWSIMLILVTLGQINIRMEIANDFIVEILIIIIGMIISFADIKVDWNLLNFDLEKDKILRQIIGYRRQFYYFAIIYNVFGRICFLTQLCTKINSRNTLLLLCIIESIRMFIWNLLVIEKEHVLNVGEFRAVPEILIEKDNILNIELKNLLAVYGERTSLERSFRNKTASLQLMIQQLEQNSQQRQL